MATKQEMIDTAIENAVLYSRYTTTRSVSDAQAYIESKRQLLTLLPQVAESNTESLRFDLATIRQEIKDAERWVLTQRVSGGGRRYLRTNPRAY